MSAVASVFEVSLVSLSCNAVTDGETVLKTEETVVAVMIDSCVKSVLMSPEPSVCVGKRTDAVSAFVLDPLNGDKKSVVVVSVLILFSSMSVPADDISRDVAAGVPVLYREDVAVTEEV